MSTLQEKTAEKSVNEKLKALKDRFYALLELRRRRRQDPDFDYMAYQDPQGKSLWAEIQRYEELAKQESERRQELYRRNARAFSNDSGTVPLKNPRSVALVGLTMAVSDAEFARVWKEKFPSAKRVASPTTAAPSVTDNASVKAAAYQTFLDEVRKLEAKNLSYTEAWIIACQNEPGARAYRKYVRACDAEKHLS